MRAQLISLALIILFTHSCKSNKEQTTGIVPSDDIKLVEGIEFGEVINHEGKSEKLLLDVYLPENTDVARHEAILWVHGGGFRGGSRKQGYIVTLSRAFAKMGYVCIAPEYRLRENPGADFQGTINDAVSDVHLALDWMTDHGKEFSYGTRKIIVGGGSAGGILLNNLCYRQEKEKHNRKIRAFINLWGSPGNEALFEEIGPKDPPCVIIHGDEDELVPFSNSELLSTGLDNAGVYHELHRLEGSGHTPVDRMDEIIDHITAFLENPETK